MRRIIEFIDWAARIHFIGTIGWGVGSWAVTFFGLSAIGWDPGTVWLGSLFGGACGSVIFIGIRTRGNRPKTVAEAPMRATKMPLTPDIDASVAFFKILRYSEWSRQQSPDSEYSIRDWLARKLDREIHNRLHQNKLTAWGYRCLNAIDETPEDVIPPKEWAKIEIDFSQRPRTVANWRVKKSGFNVAYANVRFCSHQIYAAFPLMDKIPLFNAATLVYEQIEDHMASALIEVFADTSEQRLINVCDTIARPQGQKSLVTLYGNHPPSREIKLIYMDPRNKYSFVVEGKTIVLQDNGDRFENLCVPIEEIDPAIYVLKERMKDA